MAVHAKFHAQSRSAKYRPNKPNAVLDLKLYHRQYCKSFKRLLSVPMAQASGLRSPPSSVSPAPSPRLKFDGDLLKAYIKKLLSTTLQNSPGFDIKDKDRVKAWIKEIGERVKERMLEIQPRGL